MSIGGEMSIDRIGRSSFESLAHACSMSPKLFVSRLDALSAKIVPAAEGLAERAMRDFPSPVYTKIVETIRAQVSRVR